MAFYTVKNLWYCYGCGKGGNVINFVMEKDGLTFPLAVKKLQKDTDDARMAKAYMLNRWNEKYCQEQRIGYAPKDWHSVVEFAMKKGLNLDLLQEMGI